MHQYYRNADIALIVYDITNADSFLHVRQYWKDAVLKYSENEDTKLILIGNKIDRNDERVVDSDVAEKYALNNDMSFIEMSAMNKDHFELLFHQIRTAAGQVLAIGGSHLHRSLQSPIIQLGEAGGGGGVSPTSSTPPSVSPTSPSSPPAEQGNNNNGSFRLQEEVADKPRKNIYAKYKDVNYFFVF